MLDLCYIVLYIFCTFRLYTIVQVSNSSLQTAWKLYSLAQLQV